MISMVDIEQRCLKHFQNLFKEEKDNTITNSDFIRKIKPEQNTKLMRVPNYEEIKKVVTRPPKHRQEPRARWFQRSIL